MLDLLSALMLSTCGTKGPVKTAKQTPWMCPWVLLPQNTVDKEMLFTDKLLKFAHLLFTTWPSIPNTCSLATLVPITMCFLQDHWDLETPICGFATAGGCVCTSGSQSGWNRPQGGDFERQGNEKVKEGGRGAKQHKVGEMAQPLIDHWVAFSSLLVVWLVSFLQILFYVGGCC